MESTIYNQLYSMGEILSNSWRWFWRKFWLIIAIVFIVYLPINVILNLFSVGSLNNQYEFIQALKPRLIAIQFLALLFGIIATMSIAYIIKNSIDGQKITLAQVLKKSLLKWPVALGAILLSGCYLMGLTLLLIIPGFIFSIYWVFITYSVVLENRSWKGAMDYSKAVVKGRWGKVFLYLVVFLILEMVLGFLMSTLTELLPTGLFASIAGDLFTDIVRSFFVVVYTIFFVNLDANRKEGLRNIAVAS